MKYRSMPNALFVDTKPENRVNCFAFIHLRESLNGNSGMHVY